MAPETPQEMDLSTRGTEKRTKAFCSPRVIIISPSGEFILVPYKNTNWFGLPGGKVKAQEYPSGGNLLGNAAFPTLAREVMEECDLDISTCLPKSLCFGLTEVVAVDNSQRVAKEIITPVFVCPVRQIREADLKAGTIVMNIGEHLPGPIFPDARIALAYFKKLWQAGKPTPSLPVYLNPKRLIFFQMRPTVGPLWGPPEWYK